MVRETHQGVLGRWGETPFRLGRGRGCGQDVWEEAGAWTLTLPTLRNTHSPWLYYMKLCCRFGVLRLIAVSWQRRGHGRVKVRTK